MVAALNSLILRVLISHRLFKGLDCLFSGLTWFFLRNDRWFFKEIVPEIQKETMDWFRIYGLGFCMDSGAWLFQVLRSFVFRVDQDNKTKMFTFTPFS